MDYSQLTSLRSICSKLFHLFLLTFFHHTNSISATFLSTTNTPFDFIRSSCNTTLYPEVCYTSLSHYANAVNLDPAQLARIAIGVTLVHARQAATSFSNMTRWADYGPDPRAMSAIHDCSSTFVDAVDQMRGSLKQMSHLATDVGSSVEAVRFQLGNVQTWMSAALTNEDTCSDGFKDVAECAVKAQVCRMVVNVKQFTSNALALVNTYADSVTSRK